MRERFFCLALFSLLANLLLAQFPYNNISHLSEYEEKPEFLYDFGIYPLNEKNHYFWNHFNKSKRWDYNHLVEKGVVNKVIRYDFGNKMDKVPNYKSLIKFDSLGNVEREDRWREEVLIWRKHFKYKKNKLVDRIEIQDFQEGSKGMLSLSYNYDSLHRVTSERVENQKDVTIEEQKIKYLKDTIEQTMFDYGNIRWRKWFVYKNGLLREFLMFRRDLQNATTHIKYNSKGIQIYAMIKSGQIITQYDDEGVKVSGKVFNGDNLVRSYSNHNKVKYDKFGNAVFQEFWDLGKMTSRDSSYYIYDASGNIIEKQYFKWKRNMFYKQSTVKNYYDNSERKIREELYLGDDNKVDSTIYKYSENGHLVSEEYYPAILMGEMRHRIEFKYSTNGELIRRTVYKGDGKLEYESGIKFNDWGQKIERYGDFKDEKGETLFNYKRVYDKKRRLIMYTITRLEYDNTETPMMKWELYYNDN